MVAVHNYVSRHRKALGAGALETRPPGCVLRARDGEIDAQRFEGALAASATSSRRSGLAQEAIDLLATTDELNEQAKARLSLARAIRIAGRESEADAAARTAVELLSRRGNAALLARLSG